MAHSIAIRLASLLVVASLIHAGTVPIGKGNNAKPPAQVRQHEHQHPDDWEQPAQATRQAAAVENENSYWLQQGQDFVQAKRSATTVRKRAKNVIMFLGDGMSATTIAATRPYVQSEETELSFERFPDIGMAKTYSVNYQVADSAASGTAYLGGVKANQGTIGVTAAVDRYNCTQQKLPENQVRSIAAWAQDAGKWTGFVTTSEVTDASPACLYAHSAARRWENDVELRIDCADPEVMDIASQLVNGEVGSKMRVIMGGGRSEFRDAEVADEEGTRGLRGDRRNLIAEWQANKAGQQATYVWNATHLRSIDGNNTDYLLGLFEPNDMQYNLDTVAAHAEATEPTLTEMTLKAIEVLRRNPDGFYLFVENGLIDAAHHRSFARLALDETAELAKAVAAAQAVLPEEDTLIVVTADHSHTMSYAGYPERGDEITGKQYDKADDKLPYMTLSYANGLGYRNQWVEGVGRKDLTNDDETQLFYRSPATVPLDLETHAGEDVIVYATGPWSHLFHGVYEQTVVPHLMAYAACLNGACD